MSRRLPVASSPGPLEDYAVRFDGAAGVAGTVIDAVALLESVLRSAPADGA